MLSSLEINLAVNFAKNILTYGLETIQTGHREYSAISWEKRIRWNLKIIQSALMGSGMWVPMVMDWMTFFHSIVV